MEIRSFLTELTNVCLLVWKQRFEDQFLLNKKKPRRMRGFFKSVLTIILTFRI